MPQRAFLNTAVVGACELGPEQLLAVAKALELAAGRRRGLRHGPRVLDVDLLLYGDVEIKRPELTLPHPRLRERSFYLVPLAEIAAELSVPPDGSTVGQILAGLTASGIEERLAWGIRP